MSEAKDHFRECIRLSLARNLLPLRYYAGLSQAALSKASGVSASRISDFERGIPSETPSPETVKKLADSLGCAIRELIQFIDPKP